MQFPTASMTVNDGMERQWPIGSIYENSQPTNPAILFGFGTWVPYGPGRVIVGIDSGDPDFDVAGEQGGAKTHLHGVGTLAASAHSGTAVADHASHTHDIASQITTPDLFTSNTAAAGVSGRSGGPSAVLTHGVTQPAAHTLSGSTASASNMPPYKVAYRWERIA